MGQDRFKEKIRLDGQRTISKSSNEYIEPIVAALYNEIHAIGSQVIEGVQDQQVLVRKPLVSVSRPDHLDTGSSSGNIREFGPTDSGFAYFIQGDRIKKLPNRRDNNLLKAA